MSAHTHEFDLDPKWCACGASLSNYLATPAAAYAARVAAWEQTASQQADPCARGLTVDDRRNNE